MKKEDAGHKSCLFHLLLILPVALVDFYLVATSFPVKPSILRMKFIRLSVSDGEITKKRFNFRVLLLNSMEVSRKNTIFAAKI